MALRCISPPWENGCTRPYHHSCMRIRGFQLSFCQACCRTQLLSTESMLLSISYKECSSNARSLSGLVHVSIVGHGTSRSPYQPNCNTHAELNQDLAAKCDFSFVYTKWCVDMMNVVNTLGWDSSSDLDLEGCVDTSSDCAVHLLLQVNLFQCPVVEIHLCLTQSMLHMQRRCF